MAYSNVDPYSLWAVLFGDIILMEKPSDDAPGTIIPRNVVDPPNNWQEVVYDAFAAMAPGAARIVQQYIFESGTTVQDIAKQNCMNIVDAEKAIAVAGNTFASEIIKQTKPAALNAGNAKNCIVAERHNLGNVENNLVLFYLEPLNTGERYYCLCCEEPISPALPPELLQTTVGDTITGIPFECDNKHIRNGERYVPFYPIKSTTSMASEPTEIGGIPFRCGMEQPVESGVYSALLLSALSSQIYPAELYFEAAEEQWLCDENPYSAPLSLDNCQVVYWTGYQLPAKVEDWYAALPPYGNKS